MPQLGLDVECISARAPAISLLEIDEQVMWRDSKWNR